MVCLANVLYHFGWLSFLIRLFFVPTYLPFGQFLLIFCFCFCFLFQPNAYATGPIVPITGYYMHREGSIAIDRDECFIPDEEQATIAMQISRGYLISYIVALTKNSHYNGHQADNLPYNISKLRHFLAEAYVYSKVKHSFWWQYIYCIINVTVTAPEAHSVLSDQHHYHHSKIVCNQRQPFQYGAPGNKTIHICLITKQTIVHKRPASRIQNTASR